MTETRAFELVRGMKDALLRGNAIGRLQGHALEVVLARADQARLAMRVVEAVEEAVKGGAA